MKDAGTQNPVIMLDEIDKIGASYQGDPASALLEVLDPEQNSDFLDHYLDLRFDLSKVLFICTANQLDTIPRPLLDRMETISLSGYIASEKLQIARKYLLPRQLDRAGLKRSDLRLNSETLRAIIEGYARDAGVRRLEKQLGKIVVITSYSIHYTKLYEKSLIAALGNYIATMPRLALNANNESKDSYYDIYITASFTGPHAQRNNCV